MSTALETGQVLPFYIVCDESMSMVDRIDAVNQSLVKLHQTIAADPVVCDKAQISVLTFSDSAEILVALTRLDNLASMPGCRARGGTSYGAAFRAVKDTINTDVARLKASGAKVLRPVVYFITDGEPTDDGWEAAYSDLVSPQNHLRPHILTFGVDNADAKVILQIATEVSRLGMKFAFLAEEGTDPAAALKEIIGRLAQSIVASSSAPIPQLVPPTNIPGVTNLGAIDLDEV